VRSPPLLDDPLDLVIRAGIMRNDAAPSSYRTAETGCELAASPQKNLGDYGFAVVTKPARVPVQTAVGMPALTNPKPIAPESAIGKTVKKVGARTNVTTGTLKGINHDFFLHYDSMNATFRFGDQLVIESTTLGQLFSDAGDSGSLVVTEAGEAVGIVAQGPDGADGDLLVQEPGGGLAEELLVGRPPTSDRRDYLFDADGTGKILG
jgi:hypothetical protein